MTDFVQVQKNGAGATVSLEGRTTYTLAINRPLDDDPGTIWLGLANDAGEGIDFTYETSSPPVLVAVVDSMDDQDYVKDQIRAIGKAVSEASRRFELLNKKRAAREQLAAGLIGLWTREYGSDPPGELPPGELPAG